MDKRTFMLVRAAQKQSLVDRQTPHRSNTMTMRNSQVYGNQSPLTLTHRTIGVEIQSNQTRFETATDKSCLKQDSHRCPPIAHLHSSLPINSTVDQSIWSFLWIFRVHL